MKFVRFVLPVGLVVAMSFLLVLPVVVFAADDGEKVEASFPGAQFGSMAGCDTLRTNLWLTEALMVEIIERTIQVLPPAPARILLLPETDSVMNQLYHSVSSGVFMDLGYKVFVPDSGIEDSSGFDVRYSFDVGSVELLYPETHRTLGLWKRWIARELNVTVNVKISLEETGQLLLSQRIVRRFSDRVEADDFDSIESNLYDFTAAEIAESGWNSKIEEIVVLGTLAGLIAIYFSNTGN